MHIKNLFNLLTDATDLLTFFEKVENPEQLVSRLERLKRRPVQEVRDLLTCLESLRASVEECFSDTIEPSGALDDDDPDSDEEIAALEKELAATEEPSDIDPHETDTSSQKSLPAETEQAEQTSGSTPAT